jgi:CubicO group peptidase (beta-lactamase class C family)
LKPIVSLIIFHFIVCISCNESTTRRFSNKKNPVITDSSLLQSQVTKLDERISHRVDTFFENKYKSCKLSGAYLVAKGNAIHTGAIGNRSYLNSGKVQDTDVFQLASVSKFITSLLILQLVEKNYITVNDTIQKFYPDFTYKNITINNLLSHTSGLPEYTYLTDTAWGDDSTYRNNQDAIKLLSNSGINAYFKPNQRFNYSNSNYMILAGIAEKVLNKPFTKIIEEYIYKPYNLQKLHVYQPKKLLNSQYPVKGMRGDHSLVKPHLLDGIIGDKSIYANVSDLYKLTQAFLNNRIVNSQTKYQILSPKTKVRKNQYYGYGIRITKLENGDIWHYHNGWWHGFRSYLWFNHKTKDMVIILTNRLKCGFLNPRDVIWLMQK